MLFGLAISSFVAAAKCGRALAAMVAMLFILSCTYFKGSESALPTSTTPTPSPTPTATPTPVAFYIFVAIEGSNNTSRVMRLSYNSSTNVVSGFSEVNLGTLIGGAWANSDGRGLLRLASGSLLVGNWQLTSLGVLDQALALVGGGTLSYSGTAFPGQLSMCALSGGGFAAGDTQFGGTQKIEEFSAAAAYVRTIGTLTLSLGGCAETTSTRVFWVDYDALNDADGNIKVSDFSGGAWATTASVTSDALFPGLGDSVFYDVTSHTNGYVYFFPMTLSGSRNKKVLRCSATGTLTDCATIGSDLDTFDNSLNIIQNAKQIPGTDDILFLSETTLKAYRYNTTTNGVTTIGDLAALGLANVNTWGFRGMVIVSQ